jgi:uncharacterized membrane protein required for colicin V production
MLIITNLLIVIFLLLMAAWWSNQGLFSALLHLLVTIFAGALAFALWEPITVELILPHVPYPDLAWGAGLLLPFALALSLLRFASDKLVRGNVHFADMVNTLGGGALGVIAGILTAGVVVIGLLFLGGGFNMGYQPYAMGPGGALERQQSLWVPCDAWTAGVFAGLSRGSLYPTGGPALAEAVPHVDRAAGTFNLVPREFARKSIRPEAVIEIDRSFQLAPTALPESVRPVGGDQAMVVGAQIDVTRAQDPDGTFTASRAQVALIGEHEGEATTISPAGFVHRQSQAYGNMLAGTMARTRPAASRDELDWVFHVPADFEPHYLRLKQLRFALPETPGLSGEQIEQWVAQVAWTPRAEPEEEAETDGQTEREMGPARGGPGAEFEGLEIRVGGQLPVTLSRNRLNAGATNVAVRGEENQLVSARGTLSTDQGGRVGRQLAVESVFSPPNVRVVRVEMTRDRARSLEGQVMQFAAQTQAPLLIDETGNQYQAVGYAIVSRGQIFLDIDTNQRIRAMEQIDTGQVDENEELWLYFWVAQGARLVEFRIGQASSQEINVLAE